MSSKPVVGVDIGKNFSQMCIIDPENNIIENLKIYHSNNDLKAALSILQDTEKTFGIAPVIIMESTAHYHRILQQYFSNAGFEVIVVNPIQSGILKNINVRKVKNDKVDAHHLAMLYRLKILKNINTPSDELNGLRDMLRQRSHLVDHRVAYINRLQILLDQAFPGYDKIFSEVDAKSSLAVLATYPTPEMILTVSEQELQELIGIAAGRGKHSIYGKKKAELLLNTAQEAIEISVKRPAFPCLIETTVNMVQSIQSNINALTASAKQTANDSPEIRHNIELLRSIPGVGEYSAIVLLAEIGDFSLFSKPNQLVAFCGLDPTVRQSGNFIGTKNKLSKRGSPYIRAILNICAHVAIHPGKNGCPANPVLAAYFEKKKQSKHPTAALCACMRKMILIIFAVLRDQAPFELRKPEEHISLKLVA